MRNVFISAENDTLLISLLNLRNPNALISASDFVDFSMNEPRELPYVSDYLVDFDETVEELRRFIGTSVYKGFMKLDYLIVLPDIFLHAMRLFRWRRRDVSAWHRWHNWCRIPKTLFLFHRFSLSVHLEFRGATLDSVTCRCLRFGCV